MRKPAKLKIERPSLEYYLNLNYGVTLLADKDDGGFVALIRELPGCMTQGETADEALLMMEEARTLWMETSYEDGTEIPLPSKTEPLEPLPKFGEQTEFSGYLSLRIPRKLHKDLVERANGEGVSLNQYLLYVITERSTTRSIKDVVKLMFNWMIKEDKPKKRQAIESQAKRAQ